MMYGRECWTLHKVDSTSAGQIEKNVLGKIIGPIRKIDCGTAGKTENSMKFIKNLAVSATYEYSC